MIDREQLDMMLMEAQARCHRPLASGECGDCAYSCLDQDGVRCCTHRLSSRLFVGDGDSCEHYEEC